MNRLEDYIQTFDMTDKDVKGMNWERLSLNPYLTPQMIEKYVDYWDWEKLSANPALTPALMKKYRLKLYMPWAGANPSIDAETFYELWQEDVRGESTEPPDPPFDFDEPIEEETYWALNPSLTEEMIEYGIANSGMMRHEPYETSWERLSVNRALTPRIISKYEDKWDWDNLSKNPALTAPLIEKYADKVFRTVNDDYEDGLIVTGIDKNPNLTPAMIEKYFFEHYENLNDNIDEGIDEPHFLEEDLLQNPAFTWPMIKRLLDSSYAKSGSRTRLSLFYEMCKNPNMTPARVMEWQFNFGKEKENSRVLHNFFHDKSTIEKYFEYQPYSLQDFKMLKKTIRGSHLTKDLTKCLPRNIFLTKEMMLTYPNKTKGLYRSALANATFAQNPSLSYDYLKSNKLLGSVDIFHYISNPAFLTDCFFGAINQNRVFDYQGDLKMMWYFAWVTRGIRPPNYLIERFYDMDEVWTL